MTLYGVNCSDNTGNGYVTYDDKGTSGTCLVFFIMLLNLIVMVMTAMSMASSKSKRLSVPKVLILMSATTDFLYGGLPALLQVLRYWHGLCLVGGMFGCKMQAGLGNFLSICSTLIIFLMSCERFCAFKNPLKYQVYFTMKTILVTTLGIVSYSLIVSALPLMGVGGYVNSKMGCDFDWRSRKAEYQFFIFLRIGQVLLLMLIVSILNVLVLFEMIRMFKRVQPLEPASETKVSTFKLSTQHRLVILVMATSLATIVCNLPYTIRLIEKQSGVMSFSVPDYIIKRMFIANSLVNPMLCVLYYLSDIKSKWRLICRLFCCRISANHLESTNVSQYRVSTADADGVHQHLPTSIPAIQVKKCDDETANTHDKDTCNTIATVSSGTPDRTSCDTEIECPEVKHDDINVHHL